MSISWGEIADFVGATFILLGAAFTLVAALGLLRMPDLFSRTHAAAKPQLLGLALLLTGMAVMIRTWPWISLAVAVLAIQLVAAPVGSHMLGRAAYRSGLAASAHFVVDELNDEDEEPADQTPSA